MYSQLGANYWLELFLLRRSGGSTYLSDSAVSFSDVTFIQRMHKTSAVTEEVWPRPRSEAAPIVIDSNRSRTRSIIEEIVKFPDVEY